MPDPDNIDDEILNYIEKMDDGDGVRETEIVDAVCPRPKNQASYALVLMRLQSLQKRSELYSPTPETRYRRP